MGNRICLQWVIEKPWGNCRWVTVRDGNVQEVLYLSVKKKKLDPHMRGDEPEPNPTNAMNPSVPHM